MSEATIAAFRALNSHLLNLDSVVTNIPGLLYRGKPYILKHLAIISASCQECLFLDADNIPARDPTYLFEDVDYKKTGLFLWVSAMILLVAMSF